MQLLRSKGERNGWKPFQSYSHTNDVWNHKNQHISFELNLFLNNNTFQHIVFNLFL